MLWFVLLGACALFCPRALADTKTFYFKTTWTDANPDGIFPRRMIGFNDSWPLPDIRVTKGDTVEIYIINGFETSNTTLHVHGLFQHGTNQMDGPEMVTQCPIAAGETFLYNFTVPDQVGCYWYHSHTAGQYQDGMRGAFIIDDPEHPYKDKFDEEVVLTLADHYHQNTSELLPKFLNVFNPTGAEPIPQNILMNETLNNTWHVKPSTTYMMRIVNIGGFVTQYFWLEDHNMTVIEVDGIYTEPYETDLLYITVAQRYTVLITTKDDTSKNYAMMAALDNNMLDTIPADLVQTQLHSMVYDDNNAAPAFDDRTVQDSDEILDDFLLVPLDKEELFPDADHTIEVGVVMNNLNNGVNYAFFNNLTYTPAKVPTLLTVLAAGDNAVNPAVYGSNTHSFVLQANETVDIILNNEDTGRHPFHLHGHAFQVISRGAAVPNAKDDPDAVAVAFNATTDSDFPEYPMRRDTVYVNPLSNFVIRFKADNPGVWFFHCHLEWHLEQGLALILVEDPMGIQSDPRQQISESHLNTCNKLGIPVKANAAGNSVDFLNLLGENVQQPELPAGFTARGIVALVFSCISAFLGMGAIAYYGASEITNVEERVARDLNIDLDADEERELEEDEIIIEHEREVNKAQ